MAKLSLRFRVRSLLVAVAIAGVILGGLAELQRRRERFREIADHHAFNGYYCSLYGNPELDQWHAKMHEKYERAAARPWLLVEADPPAPPSLIIPATLGPSDVPIDERNTPPRWRIP
jgi:hypothetical protein